jgi:hypothetical protein
MPASSSTSRRTAASTVSPGSTKPASAEYIRSGQPGERPSSTRLPRRDQHDHDRIGAREMRRAAGRAACAASRPGAGAFRPAGAQYPCVRCQLSSAAGGRGQFRVAGRERGHDAAQLGESCLSVSEGCRWTLRSMKAPTCASSTSSGTQPETSTAKSGAPSASRARGRSAPLPPPRGSGGRRGRKARRTGPSPSCVTSGLPRQTGRMPAPWPSAASSASASDRKCAALSRADPPKTTVLASRIPMPPVADLPITMAHSPQKASAASVLWKYGWHRCFPAPQNIVFFAK